MSLGAVGETSAAAAHEGYGAIASIANGVAEGRVSARDLAERSIDIANRIASLNALNHVDADRIVAEAEAVDRRVRKGGPVGGMAGVPITVKDNIDVAGLATTAGTPALREWRPARSSPVVERLTDEGGIIIAKSVPHELAFGITSQNATFGQVRHPWLTDAIPGGSSGGSAVAVATGVSALGLGSDTGGSVRIPAALCGIVGYRPSMERYSSRGLVRISHTRDTVGLLARTVADVAWTDSLITRGTWNGHRLGSVDAPVLGVPEHIFYEDLDPVVAGAMDEALAAVERAGGRLKPVAARSLAEPWHAAALPIVLFEAPREIAHYLSSSGTGLGLTDVVDNIADDHIRALLADQLAPERAVSSATYREALVGARRRLADAFTQIMDEASGQRLDGLLVPTTPLPARPVAEDGTVEHNGRRRPAFETYIRNTDASATAGLASITLPVPSTLGDRPVGVEIVTRMNEDNALFALATFVESAMA